MSSGRLDYTVSAVSLIDPVNAKRYRVARNGTGQDAKCVCSGTQGSPRERRRHHALRGLRRPARRRHEDQVEMPMMGVFTDVPIS